MSTRRQFLGSGAALIAAAGLPAAARQDRHDELVGVEPAERALDLLILGGTGFIGPHQVEYALARGHNVTVFNRGRREGLFGNRVERLTGDRDTNVGDGLKALEGDRRWDAVIDNSGYITRHVRDSAELLAERTERYLFTSTVAAYDYEQDQDIDEAGPILAGPDPGVEQVSPTTYGPLKADCERAVNAVFGERATIVRPCYIVGPGDTSDRFTYWVDRLARGGDVVCPAHPDFEAQWIDARDLCPFMVKLVEDGQAGAFNGVGPASKVTNEQLMWALRAFCDGPIELHWPTTELLDELRFPTPMFDWRRIDRHTQGEKAAAAGLVRRSLADSARDTLEWWHAQPELRRERARGWPSAERELALLERLRG